MNAATKSELIQIIKQLSSKKVMVIGDLMLDQYIWGKVERISPEAPIPVILAEREEFRLGGAANVAANIKALGGEVYPVGLIGNCSFAQRILSIFEEKKISQDCVIISDLFQTIVKQRYLTFQQQLLRVDFELPATKSRALSGRILRAIESVIAEMDCVIISDYAKGVITEKLVSFVVKEAKRNGTPVVCDPGKGTDFTRYQGVTTLKPNRSETELLTNIPLTNDESILKAAAILKNQSQAEFLSISLDKDGILLYFDENRYHFVETEAREVYDVTGAGDIVISVIAYLLANKVDPLMCVRMANVAAELEISHMGVVSIPWTEITNHLASDSLNQKIVEIKDIEVELKLLKDTAIVFTNGYFDNISSGHLRYLMELNQFKGKLIVAINSDDSILKQKGSPPLLKEQDRARILASLQNVFKVIIFDEDNASNVIKLIKPDIVVKGDHFKDKILPEDEAIKQVGAEIAYIQHY